MNHASPGPMLRGRQFFGGSFLITLKQDHRINEKSLDNT